MSTRTEVSVTTADPKYPHTWHDHCANGRLKITNTLRESGLHVTLKTDADTGEFFQGLIGYPGKPMSRAYKSVAGTARAIKSFEER